MPVGLDERRAFEAFVVEVEPRLHRALVAAYGPDRGRDAVCEALAYGWEHWERIRAMDNPVGYLFRVGQSRTRHRRIPVMFPPPRPDADVWFEPELAAGLAELSVRQRVAVFLLEGQQWTVQEVADLLGVSRSTVQTHHERGLAKLREHLGVRDGIK